MNSDASSRGAGCGRGVWRRIGKASPSFLKMKLRRGGPLHHAAIDSLVRSSPKTSRAATLRTAVRSNLAARRHDCTDEELGAGPDRTSPRVEQALAAMRVLTEFSVGYAQGSAIPDDIQRHGRIVADYLGYPERWLWQWLNGSWRD
jgi:hypothetical protein